MNDFTDDTADSRELYEELAGYLKFDLISARKIMGRDEVASTERLLACINGTGKYTINKNGARLRFNQPCFVSSVKVYSKKKNIKSYTVGIDGGSTYVKGTFGADEGGDFISFYFNKVASEVCFEVDQGIIFDKTAEVGKILIFNWSVSDFHEIEEQLRKAREIDDDLTKKWSGVQARLKDKLDMLQEEMDAVDRKKSEVSAETKQLEDEVISLGNERAEIRASLVDVKLDLESQASRKTELDARVGELLAKEGVLLAELDKKTATLKVTSEEVAKKEVEYKKLKSDVNLFPDDLRGFTERTEKNRKEYFWLSAVPLVIFVSFTFLFVSSAQSLVEHESFKGMDSVIPFLLQRIPYVLIVSSFVCGAFVFLTHILSRIEEIHQQELNLSKISIVARDIAISEFGEGDDDDIVQQKRIDLKIQMIQSYLASEFVRAEKEMDRKSARYEAYSGNLLSTLMGVFGVVGKGKEKASE